MNRKRESLVQGSDEWDAFRLEHHGASEAPAMMGLKKGLTRNELLAAKHTGNPKEYSAFLLERIFPNGHKVEALARPIAEEILGEDLFAETYSMGKLSASCDGITMGGEVAWEHKQWNAEMAELVAAGFVPDEHQPQCQQIMMVTGARRVLFMVSDGTRDRCVHTFVEPSPEWQKRIVSGWAQFDEDLANYQHVEILPAPVARPSMSLPALSIQVTGSIALVDNLKVFGERLQEFIGNLDQNPSDDQAFADSEAAIKTLQAAQDALEAAEASALAQTASIDEMRRTVAMYSEQARKTRLMLEKLVKARKETIRVEIVDGGKRRFAEHLAHLTKLIGKPYMPTIPVDFAGVIKGKKTVASLHNAVDTELARAKIAANDIFNNIMTNLSVLRELSTGYEFLFSDEGALVLRDEDSLRAIAKSRIADHQAAEAKRLEEERARIRAEEEEKLRRETAEREQAERAEADRIAAEAEAQQRERVEQLQKSAPALAIPPPLSLALKQKIEEHSPAVVPIAAPAPQGRGLGSARRIGNWTAQLTVTEKEAIAAILCEIDCRPELADLLRIDMDAVNRLCTDRNSFNVPGFRAVFIPEPTYGEVK